MSFIKLIKRAAEKDKKKQLKYYLSGRGKRTIQGIKLPPQFNGKIK